MRKWIYYAFPIIVIFILSSYGFTLNKVEVPKTLRVSEAFLVANPQRHSQINEQEVIPPFLGSRFTGFKEALAFKESQGNYFVINTYGYLGKYQFGINTLNLVGVYSGKEFLSDPQLQEKVFDINLSRNKWILRRDIKRFQGKYIDGIKITESGILAAAHLAGPGNVQRYLRSFGKKDVTDGYGTSIANYIHKFSGYDTSVVTAVRNPRI
ncbi:hypothetical protein EJ994_03715 [Maribacter sp. MJ134]|uniref:hypothetical protein n=1 Tax=Maribacter sp. MJ134 TaxID=2496865 RepID=UPI000F817CA7|nr:hypothetical protein [Maribacter sp. MJ134]AZQ57952.1 hypothetical protein EJ994_03715 [Maribacter sp. MJ134]